MLDKQSYFLLINLPLVIVIKYSSPVSTTLSSELGADFCLLRMPSPYF